MPIELNSKYESRNTKQIQDSNYQNTKRLLLLDGRFCFENSYFGHSILFRISDFVLRIFPAPRAATTAWPMTGNAGWDWIRPILPTETAISTRTAIRTSKNTSTASSGNHARLAQPRSFEGAARIMWRQFWKVCLSDRRRRRPALSLQQVTG